MTEIDWSNPDCHISLVIAALSNMDQLSGLAEYHRLMRLHETPKELVVRPPVEELIMDLSRLELLKMTYLIAAIKTETEESAMQGHIERLIESYLTLEHYQIHQTKDDHESITRPRL